MTWKKIIGRIFSFNGRAGQLELWLIVILSFIISISFFYFYTYFFAYNLFEEYFFEKAGWLSFLIFIIPVIPVLIRRLHDVGISAWLFPLFFIWICDKPENGCNKYGPPAKECDLFDFDSVLDFITHAGIAGKTGKVIAGIIYALFLSVIVLLSIGATMKLIERTGKTYNTYKRILSK